MSARNYIWRQQASSLPSILNWPILRSHSQQWITLLGCDLLTCHSMFIPSIFVSYPSSNASTFILPNFRYRVLKPPTVLSTHRSNEVWLCTGIRRRRCQTQNSERFLRFPLWFGASTKVARLWTYVNLCGAIPTHSTANVSLHIIGSIGGGGEGVFTSR